MALVKCKSCDKEISEYAETCSHCGAPVKVQNSKPSSGLGAVIRFAALAFLTPYSFSMGEVPPSGLNAFGKFISSLFFIAAPALYMLPTIEASFKKHANLTAVALTNVFLGWTFLGWVFTYVWAFKKPSVVVLAEPVSQSVAQGDSSHTDGTKTCPFCAEKVLLAAIKCKHCGSQLS